ncbi:PLP-dependent transferase [Agrocybe pediades]|nr:PLP-dependent transferase [Agrocybe pediades]
MLLPAVTHDDEYAGSFGSIPAPVLRSCEELTRECERYPDAFIRQLLDRQTKVRTEAARLIGAGDPDTCVFLSNVSTAMNTILQSFKWSPQDYLICTDAIFPSITLAIEKLSPGPTVSTFKILAEGSSHESVISGFRALVDDVKAAVQLKSGKEHSKGSITESPKIVVIMETITASPSILLPWKKMVRICRDESIWSIVDAAHSLGQETDINVEEVDPDFWMTDCAKWYYTMRGCALLYAPLRNTKHIVPLVPGVRYPTRGPTPTEHVHSFFWNGLTDPVASLSIEYATDFRKRLGGEKMINAYCHTLAVAGGGLVARSLGTTVLDTTESGELTGNMTNVELPISPKIQQSSRVYFFFDDEMLQKHKICVSLFHYMGRWWVRISAQIYNDVGFCIP